MSIPVVSLFSGCGGLDLGFAQQDFASVLALDVNPSAVKTYNANHGEGIAQVADLSKVDGKDIIALLEERKAAVPKGIIGGSPCQTFSEANRYAKDDDVRHTLPEKYASILKTLNEQYDLDFFVFENVEGITFKEHRKNFSRFKELFEDAGFVLFEGLLDAQHFGVPQRRPRVFVVGFNKRRYREWMFEFPVGDATTISTVAGAIRGLPEPVFFQRGLTPEGIPHHPNHWTMRPKSKKFADGFLQEGQIKGRSFRVLSWDAPSWTVAYGNREVHVHPTGERRLSVYEAMLLQGFPKRYQLCGNLSSQIEQVSDAVPPPLADALAHSIRLFLDGDNRVPRIQSPLIEGDGWDVPVDKPLARDDRATRAG